jgi:hypothetical protein
MPIHDSNNVHASIPRSSSCSGSTSGTATCPLPMARDWARARGATSSAAKRTPHTNPKHACPHLYKLPTVHCTSSTAGIMSHPWNRGPTPCRLPCDNRRSKLQPQKRNMYKLPHAGHPGRWPVSTPGVYSSHNCFQVSRCSIKARRSQKWETRGLAVTVLTETTTFPGPGGRLSACQALPS